jgi:spermidine synthase
LIAMADTPDPTEHVKPFVHATRTAKALHFSICEIQSRMKLDDPYELDLAYTRTMMGFLLLQPDPRRIAMIGLGGGSLAKFCHRHLPAACIEVVEINPHVIALRDEFLVPPDDERLHVIQGDGARWVRDQTRQPDVLMVDGFDSDGQPGALCSQRFYDDCFDLLAPAGVMVVNLHAGHRQHERHVDRIQRSFAGAALRVADDAQTNGVVFACKGDALTRASSGPLRRPKGLARTAAAALRDAFGQVSRAIKERDRDAA